MPDGTWREVVYIGHRTGDRGGRYWVLLLDCGHRDFRRIPRAGFEAALGRGPVMTHAPTAPRRVRCTSCGLGAEPRPETIAASMRMLDRLEGKDVV